MGTSKNHQGPFKPGKEEYGAMARRGNGDAPAPTDSTSAAARTSSSTTKNLVKIAHFLNKMFLARCNALAETKPTADWSCLMKDYLGYSRAIEKEYFEEVNKLKKTSGGGSGGSSAPSAATTSVSTADPHKSALEKMAEKESICFLSKYATCTENREITGAPKLLSDFHEN